MRYSRYICPHLSAIQNLHQSIPISPFLLRRFSHDAQPQSQPPPAPAAGAGAGAPSDRVNAIVEEISSLTLLEVSDLTEVLRQKFDIKEMPVMAMMMPGMGFAGMPGVPRGGAGGAATAGKGEEKVEKTVFDVKLEGFDAAAKIKVIKEVRGFTDLGLKEAKDLVEKAPTLMKKGVTKEEAEKIIAKLKEVGAKVSME